MLTQGAQLIEAHIEMIVIDIGLDLVLGLDHHHIEEKNIDQTQGPDPDHIPDLGLGLGLLYRQHGHMTSFQV